MASQYEILIYRHHEVRNVKKNPNSKPEDSTVGNLTILKDNIPIFYCFTIENGGPSTDIPNKDKRIMAGTYYLERSLTRVPLPTKLNQKGLLLTKKEDPSFAKRRIFIHMGNFPQDTEGCILLNSSYNLVAQEGFGYKSKDAVIKFYDIFADVDLRQVTLEVMETGYVRNDN